MKNKLTILLGLVGLLVCAAGCNTVRTEGGRDVAVLIKTSAYLGTHYSLIKHPEWRAGFEVAADQLLILETSETVDFVTILAIVNRLPVKELKGDEAALIVTGATILLTEYGGAVLPLDQVEKARPIVAALRQGIELGLARSVQ